MAIITCLGNSLVLWGRFTQRDENHAVSMVIRNLAVSDILMGVYLSIIGIQDWKFREEYHSHSFEWIASWHCTFTGVLAMISSEVSLLILTFISVERFLLIAGPFGGRRRLTSHNVFLCLFIIWLIGIAIAIIPGIVAFQERRKRKDFSIFDFFVYCSDPLAQKYIVLWFIFGHMFSAPFTRTLSNWMAIFGCYFYGFQYVFIDNNWRFIFCIIYVNLANTEANTAWCIRL